MTIAHEPVGRVAFFVSPDGDDAAAGTSPETAWRTLHEVNRRDLEPGSDILLEGGARFEGFLEFQPEDAGETHNPIRVGSYGVGPATIDAGDGTAIYGYNVGGFEIVGLTLEGSGVGVNTGFGVMMYTDLAGEGRIDHVVVSDVEVSGFTDGGIALEGNNGVDYARGYDDITITHNDIHDNGDFGIATLGYWESHTTQTGYAHTNVYVAYNRVYDNAGKPDKDFAHTGDGIMLSMVDDAVIEHNEAFRNGAANISPSEGPVGIWAWEANDVLIQYNESHHNSGGAGVDGDGMDFDGGVTNSVMQYNYAHDNAGAGFLVAQFGGARQTSDNVVRYNVAVNNGSANAYGGIAIWAAENEILGQHDIYNNTVFASDLPTGDPSAVSILSGQYSTVLFRNNVFVVDGDVPLIDAVNVTGVYFEHNAYWSEQGEPLFQWGDEAFVSLADWRLGSEQEFDGAALLGLDIDPLLFAPGGLSIESYVPRPDSPLVDAGSPFPEGMEIKRDFLGQPVPSGSGIDIGAFEVPGGRAREL